MNHPSPTSRILLLLAAAALAGCDSGAEPLRPAAFELLPPEAQTATVGSPVPVTPGVRVTTADGRAVPGVDVVFTVTGGRGTLSGAQAVSDASGTARPASWTLGTQAGRNTLGVSSPDMQNVRATITATAVADAPAGLGVQVQPSALVASGTPLAVQPVVRLLDRFGNPAAGAGVAVTAATQGDVALEGDTAITDADGVARFTGLALHGPAGSYILRFAAAGLAQAAAGSATQLTGGAAHHLALAVQPPRTAFLGVRLHPAPAVNVLDEHGSPAVAAQTAITASIEGSGGALLGTTSVTAQNGTAVFADLAFPDSGAYRLRFTVADLGDVLSDSVRVVPPGGLTCAAVGREPLQLQFELGHTVRFTADAAAASCLEFDAASAAGQQYLVLFENMPLRGDTALFPGAGSAPEFSVSLQSLPTTPLAAQPAARAFPNALAAESPRHQWDFGDGPIYEGRVESPPGGVPTPRLLGESGSIPLSSVLAHPVPGDTIEVYLAGIPRLSIPNGTQRTVVRLVSDHLVIAEDIRLPALARQGGGGSNRFLEPAELDSLTAQYALHARVQGDMLFEGRHNSAVESWGTPPRVLAVHTLMYADNVWGYTWPNMHYFAFDYFVGSPDGVTKSYSQNATRVADNLFMHEIAHMRHFGLSERAGVSMAARGNTWLVEGFARATERLPIAMRLLGTATPSRLDNLVLPRNTEAFGTAYFFDDVPTYLQAGAGMFAGYSASAYVFDYFADQVALAGSDPLAALREFVVYGGNESTLNEVIARWLGEQVTFPELFTRARIALYADDYGPGLPPSTQYLQYQLRTSRPPGTQSASDPRNAWLKLSPGVPESVPTVTLAAGAARGVLIDGTVPSVADARILIDATRVANGVISVTRVR